MGRPKKIVEDIIDNETSSHIIIVMDSDNEIVRIDANKEKDWMTKYRHRSGAPFN